MGMSMHIVGFTPPDEKWLKMKKIWDACEAADIEMPEEVEEFFNYEPPDEEGVLINLKNTGFAVKEWSAEMEEGFQVELSKLPKDIKLIRFYCSF